jgi:amidase
MLFVDRDDPRYSIDPKGKPVAMVESGASLIVATHDARTGKLKQADEVMLTAPDFSEKFPKTVPVTGPIVVNGCEPGDALVVEILAIELDQSGFLIVKPKLGLVQGLVEQDTAKIVTVSENVVRFDDLELPVRPMVGVIATAPAGEAVAPIFNGRHGGNLDCSQIAPGARVRMPVRVPGGMLYLGDVHATMGDGEACGTGVEIGARVHIRVSVEKAGARSWPWVEVDDRLITIATAPDFAMASELATREMMELLRQRHGVSSVEAFMLVSAAGDIRVNQACRYPIDVSARVEFPKLPVKSAAQR